MVNEGPMTLKVPGRAVDRPPLPRVLSRRGRAEGSAAEDPFLPRGYVQPTAAFDLSAAARAAEGGAVEKAVQVRPGQVIVLELADGLVVFTSPERLKKTLTAIALPAIDPKDGSLRLDALNDRGAAVRRSLGGALSHLILRVTTLDVGAAADAILTAARAKALEWLHEKGEETLAHYAELGVSWLGTKALMWAIERRLPQAPGLYRWAGATGEAAEFFGAGDPRLEADARQGPLLVFIHGIGSSSEGSFSELRTVSREYWRPFQACFGERIYAFEHRTLSESPIENALQLARVLPDRARLCLVTHSRGGLIGDLLCLDRLDGADRRWIDTYAVDEVALGCAEGAERERLRKELAAAYGEQRAHLRELASVLRRKQFVIERYVRVACPARGTRLASGNFDVFLSGLLSLIGLVPVLAGSPLYSAFTRVVLEIAKNRTAPNLVPGLEALLPESPMGRLLAHVTPQAATSLAVIAGDIDGGGLLKRLGLLFTDNAFFAGHDNDLVVDTDSMYAGVARPGVARFLFDRGPDVSHFRYFANDDTRGALRRWLIEPDLDGIDVFTPLPDPGIKRPAPRDLRRGTVGRPAPDGKRGRPVVVVLPGIMGSHLQHRRKDRIWFDFEKLIAGGLAKLRYGKPAIGAEALFELFYGKLCDYLAGSHRVEPLKKGTIRRRRCGCWPTAWEGSSCAP